jgi:hypothetical protein
MAKESSARKLRKQYVQLLPLLQGVGKFVQRILEDLPPADFKFEHNVKPYKRTVEKAQERKHKNLTDLSDLARGRLFFSDNFNHDEVVELLKQLFDGKVDINKVDKKHERGHGLDYKGIYHVDCKIGDLNFELQVMPEEFKPYKELLHKIYDQLRTDPHLDDKKKSFLAETHNKIINKLDKMSKENRKGSSD